MRVNFKIITASLLLTLTASAAAPRASMTLPLRTQVQAFHGDGPWEEANFSAPLVPAETAIIVTDMWDKHWCSGATKRVGEIAVRMNPVLTQARRAGILIIHSPSDTMAYYEKTPGRRMAEDAPHVQPPDEIQFEKAPLPIDDKDGGCDTPPDAFHRAWRHETNALTIAPGDAISDNGTEVYNVLQERHINTVIYMGVHANKCILNRTFGMRQMAKWGLRTILVRDLTDAMYNPASKPFVSHAAGTELVIEYIEKYIAPTTTSHALMTALASTSPKTSAIRK